VSNPLREAAFAVRVVQRREGKAAIVYRRRPDAERRDRLQRVGVVSPLAFTAGTSLLREAVAKSRETFRREGMRVRHTVFEHLHGTYEPLDAEWGPRLAVYALVTGGLRNGERLMKAASHLRYADANEAAWWLGLLTRYDNTRAVRALRILTDAVE
jgi:hypothetical protein